MIFRFWAAVTLTLALFLSANAATISVTVNQTNQLSVPFLPAASTGTGVTNSAAWSASRTILGIPSWIEGYESLTDSANVTLDWLKGRTKGITLNQNTTFSFINTPSGSTNIQTMVVQVVGDGTSSVNFTGVSWQTAQLAVPDAGNIALYFFRARSGGVVGYVGLGNNPGAALWSSVTGVLVPDPQVDEVSIVSRTDTTGSNILLNLDTDASWVDGETLLRVATGGVVQFRIDANTGSTGLGTQVFLDNGKFGSVAAVGQQVFSGFYGGGLPIDVPTTSAAIAYDLDPPNTTYQWDGSVWY